jgi:hypothetical protein
MIIIVFRLMMTISDDQIQCDYHILISMWMIHGQFRDSISQFPAALQDPFQRNSILSL